MNRGEYLRDVWIGAVTAVIALVYLWLIPSQVAGDTDGYDGISGRTLPYFIGVVLLALGVLLALSSARKARKAQAGAAAIVSWPTAQRVLIYTLAIALYTVGIATIGYVVATLVVLPFAMYFSGARRWRTLVLTTLIVPPALYWFFHVIMQIPMPEALLI